MRYIIFSMLLACTVWPVGSVLAGDVFNGKKIYEQHCKGCHGTRGRAMMPGAPSFRRGEGLLQTDPALFNTIRSGRNAMPGFQGVLDEYEILDVISYIRTFY